MAVRGKDTRPKRKIRITAGDKEIETHIGREGCDEDCTALNVLANTLHGLVGATVKEIALGGDGQARTISGVDASQVATDEEAARGKVHAAQKQPARQSNG